MVTVCPQARRFLEMGKPILPRPKKARRMIIPPDGAKRRDVSLLFEILLGGRRVFFDDRGIYQLFHLAAAADDQRGGLLDAVGVH